jgi:hypothetical protein
VQGSGKGDPVKTPACIDAETLAAWADGGLPTAEAAAVELHLADCERCTAMLATFVRTVPDVPATESLWKRWHLRWLVPAATAATVAALWILIPDSDRLPTPTTEDSRATDTFSSPRVAAPPPPQAAAVETPKEEAEANARSRPAPTDTFAKRDADRAAQSLQTAQQPPQQQARADEARQEAFSPVPAAPPPAPAPARPREADSTAEKSILDAQSRPAAAGTAGAPAAVAGAPPPAANAEPPTSALRRGNIATLAGSVAQFEIVSPDPMTRWRVIGAGQVERSTNAGAQWQRATLPESATLTGGSSPSPSICWLVGRTGAIYVTTDGLRFTKVPFRDRVDFVSIQAIDARRATVITADGRTMRTEDQGATWTRITP